MPWLQFRAIRCSLPIFKSPFEDPPREPKSSQNHRKSKILRIFTSHAAQRGGARPSATECGTRVVRPLKNPQYTRIQETKDPKDSGAPRSTPLSCQRHGGGRRFSPLGEREGERLGRVLGAVLGCRRGGPKVYIKNCKTNENWWFSMGFGRSGEGMGSLLGNTMRLRKGLRGSRNASQGSIF